MTAVDETVPGWLPDEVVLDQPTRSSRLRWVLVVDADLPAGVAVNAAACTAAQVGSSVAGLLGPGGPDADGTFHPGLPWAGCSVLAAPAEQLSGIAAKAAAALGVWAVGMPASAQTNRVYAEYLQELATTPADGLALRALSLVGPRNRIDKLVGKLPLLR
ncbi:DUF2000 domain-containing protein [Modestobacter sp. NPDC049651]|uniref:DUF2000 domain-containing protein n=1 Tax=unclassified Modestobacter TaxID=2643866 RepID=UPI0033C726F9